MEIGFAQKIKKSLLRVSVSLILYGCSSHTDKRIIGEWKNSSDNTDMILDDSNHVFFMRGNNQVDGGNDFKIDGHKAELKYEIDYSKSPIWLDMITVVYGKDGEIGEGRLKGIVKFLTDKKIEYRVGNKITDERPVEFDKANTEILDKQN